MKAESQSKEGSLTVSSSLRESDYRMSKGTSGVEEVDVWVVVKVVSVRIDMKVATK